MSQTNLFHAFVEIDMSRTEKLLHALYSQLTLESIAGNEKRVAEIKAQIRLILRDQALRSEMGMV